MYAWMYGRMLYVFTKYMCVYRHMNVVRDVYDCMRVLSANLAREALQCEGYAHVWACLHIHELLGMTLCISTNITRNPHLTPNPRLPPYIP